MYVNPAFKTDPVIRVGTMCPGLSCAIPRPSQRFLVTHRLMPNARISGHAFELKLFAGEHAPKPALGRAKFYGIGRGDDDSLHSPMW